VNDSSLKKFSGILFVSSKFRSAAASLSFSSRLVIFLNPALSIAARNVFSS
jgi:hypothetical protein